MINNIMAKLGPYLLLILIYLGLSKIFSASEQYWEYIDSEKNLVNIALQRPSEFILTAQYESGTLIKTYYQHYKIIGPSPVPNYIIVRTSKHFYEQCRPYMGLSLLRRSIHDEISTTPLPPGQLFIGDHTYGEWIFNEAGSKVWKFYQIYDYYLELLNYGSFVPSYSFFEDMQIHKSENRPYFGANNEFGTSGSLNRTQYGIGHSHLSETEYIKKYFHELFQSHHHRKAYIQ